MSNYINASYWLHTSQDDRKCRGRWDKPTTYKLPLRVFDDSRDVENEIVIDTMMMYPPSTRVEPGTLVTLKAVPSRLQRGLFCVGGYLPSVWKVRYTISLWGYTVMKEAQSERYWDDGYFRFDLLIDHVSAMLPQGSWKQSLAYVHAMPHGMYPDSALYVPERHLQIVPGVADGNAETLAPWEEITDEANTHFLGYDVSRHFTGIDLDMAPDDYCAGEPVGVFVHEEPTIHTLCILGFEEDLMVPKDPQEMMWKLKQTDPVRHPDNDILVNHQQWPLDEPE